MSEYVSEKSGWSYLKTSYSNTITSLTICFPKILKPISKHISNYSRQIFEICPILMSYTLFYFKTRKIGRQAIIICIKVLLWIIIFEYCEKHTEAIFQTELEIVVIKGWRVENSQNLKTLPNVHYLSSLTNLFETFPIYWRWRLFACQVETFSWIKTKERDKQQIPLRGVFHLFNI